MSTFFKSIGKTEMANILVVDDSETFREQLRKVLQNAGHVVVEGGDGLQGLDALKAHPNIDVILLDINMPNLDGLGMCRRMVDDIGRATIKHVDHFALCRVLHHGFPSGSRY